VIVLQNSKVEGLRIFRKNKKPNAIADSYSLCRATELAYEFKSRSGKFLNLMNRM
jgi:hypothetical protein